MKFEFSSEDDYQMLWQSVHDSIIYWQKKRQEAQGKIRLRVDGGDFGVESEERCISLMVQNAKILKAIEDSPHKEWNDETKSFEFVYGVESYSSIITKTLKLETPSDD